MPITIDCSECGHVLYEVEAPNLTLYHDFLPTVISNHNGKCPKCGHKLVLPKDRTRPADYVQVAPFKTTNAEVFTKFGAPNRKAHHITVSNELVTRMVTTREALVCVLCNRPIRTGDGAYVSRNRRGTRYRHKSCYLESIVE